jgi:hypothetical protein
MKSKHHMTKRTTIMNMKTNQKIGLSLGAALVTSILLNTGSKIEARTDLPCLQFSATPSFSRYFFSRFGRLV